MALNIHIDPQPRTETTAHCTTRCTGTAHIAGAHTRGIQSVHLWSTPQCTFGHSDRSARIIESHRSSHLPHDALAGGDEADGIAPELKVLGLAVVPEVSILPVRDDAVEVGKRPVAVLPVRHDEHEREVQQRHQRLPDVNHLRRHVAT
eukprot:1180439-Prorocentrum_minimum.AAC.2